MNEYKKCLQSARKKNLSLCPEGYCTAKLKFDVYPSAYANGYASQVCNGSKMTYDEEYISNQKLYKKSPKNKNNQNSPRNKKSLKNKNSPKNKNNQKNNNNLNNKNNLQRWFDEKWVNVCEKDKNGIGGYKVCGSGKGVDDLDNYPYCRPYYKLPGTSVVTVNELKESEIKEMCKQKRSKLQGLNGKPTYTYLPKYIRNRK